MDLAGPSVPHQEGIRAPVLLIQGVGRRGNWLLSQTPLPSRPPNQERISPFQTPLCPGTISVMLRVSRHRQGCSLGPPGNEASVLGYYFRTSPNRLPAACGGLSFAFQLILFSFAVHLAQVQLRSVCSARPLKSSVTLYCLRKEV